ncbi:hypothetical protein Kpol_460p9 [Vanderwaltozyma polyspora DSM 70294]|uniref:Uncharacterized protein n=1 Tax=Vanderwaltozyma polyspora (strain ATCC 22028 / DSM 70294 / BCRC 21397 / CBS 2163 / NBRC 10782 / NRRL Y-8283 / UCD 57-17) TaxID=436907 RepID=A7TQS5_VANPO|nr:uncharacterized protein Kpol_460p9 [Vanderwaltozyma polyspora DSM 70294]EDO15374.1 hypothetical protein Kpol_460p9 [Vanderwaltozyma polyspora DSM 70294]
MEAKAVNKGKFIHRLYQYYHICTTFLFCTLLARWLILMPLVGSRYLPGAVHELLIYLLGISSLIELFWRFYFHGLKNGFMSLTTLKDVNFLYFVRVMHFYDDYEYELVLKNTTYSSFIIGLSFTQAYCHWNNLFKRQKSSYGIRSIYWKINTWIMMPTLYLSEFYLLLLNNRNPNFHSTPLLDKINKCALVVFIPISLIALKKHISKI